MSEILTNLDKGCYCFPNVFQCTSLCWTCNPFQPLVAIFFYNTWLIQFWLSAPHSNYVSSVNLVLPSILLSLQNHYHFPRGTGSSIVLNNEHLHMDYELFLGQKIMDCFYYSIAPKIHNSNGWRYCKFRWTQNRNCSDAHRFNE